MTQIGFRERILDGKPLLAKEIFDIEDRLLNYAENNGYPFARVWLDSVTARNGEVSAALMMQTGAVFILDSVRTEGTAKIGLRFLENYLDFRKGAVFSRAKVLKISQRLAELPYLTEKKRPSVSFTEIRTARLTLFLNEKKQHRLTKSLLFLIYTVWVPTIGPEFRVWYKNPIPMKDLQQILWL